MKIGSLFTGYRGLDVAAEWFFGATTIWWSDIDPGAVKINEHHWPGQPNLGDITTVDWADVEPVDIITGGWPCQPFSHAGKRKGAQDERALWPYLAGAIRALRPRYIVLENVAAITTAGELSRATADLASLGYVGSWRCVRASDVGAPHGRARIFILAADTAGARQAGLQDARAGCGDACTGARGEESERDGRAPTADTRGQAGQERTGLRQAESGGLGCGRSNDDHPSPPAADTEGNRWDEGWPESARQLGRPDAAECCAGPVADADGGRLEGGRRLESVGCDADRCGCADGDGGTRESATLTTADAVGGWPHEQVERGPTATGSGEGPWRIYEAAIERWERILGRIAPSPVELTPRGTWRLSPLFVEWMMGLPEGHVTGVPGLSRNNQLKALGNGVVPQQAQEALRRMGNVYINEATGA